MFVAANKTNAYADIESKQIKSMTLQEQDEKRCWKHDEIDRKLILRIFCFVIYVYNSY